MFRGQGRSSLGFDHFLLHQGGQWKELQRRFLSLVITMTSGTLQSHCPSPGQSRLGPCTSSSAACRHRPWAPQEAGGGGGAGAITVLMRNDFRKITEQKLIR